MPLNPFWLSFNCPFIGKLTLLCRIFFDPLFFLAFPRFPPAPGTTHQYHHSNEKSLMVSCLSTVRVYAVLCWVVGCHHQLQGERREFRATVDSELLISIPYLPPEGVLHCMVMVRDISLSLASREQCVLQGTAARKSWGWVCCRSIVKCASLGFVCTGLWR